MSIFQSVILGIIQGIGEFLPISSSAHLIVAPFLFGWSEHTLAFDVALHFGTLIAVLAIFWRDWFNIAKGAFYRVTKGTKSTESNMFWYLVVATIPGAIIGKILESQSESFFRSALWLIALALGIMGILIYIGDKYAQKKYKGKEITFEKMTLKHALAIGLSQSLAIIPGFSRSGTTILTGRLMGLSREAAAKFTFLLSVPIILGATIFKIGDLATGFSTELLIGVVVSAVVGIISIKFLLGYIKKNDFAIFAYYRVIIAIIILVKFFVVK